MSEQTNSVVAISAADLAEGFYSDPVPEEIESLQAQVSELEERLKQARSLLPQAPQAPRTITEAKGTKGGAGAVCAQLSTSPQTLRQLIDLARERCPGQVASTRYATEYVQCPALSALVAAGRVVREGNTYRLPG